MTPSYKQAIPPMKLFLHKYVRAQPLVVLIIRLQFACRDYYYGG
jgi:hypothetical protein